MRRSDLNLSILRHVLEEALDGYTQLYDGKLLFQNFPDFKRTPEKPNSARTIIPVTYDRQSVGDLTVIVLVKHDGTGDESAYKVSDLEMPRSLEKGEIPSRLVPRSKSGIICEAFFPMFSVLNSGKVAMYSTHLDELVLENNSKIREGLKLGQPEPEYLATLGGKLKVEPKLFATTGYDAKGDRFGDPHCIYFKECTYDAAQVVGFLAIKDKNSPLIEISKSWHLPFADFC